MLIACSLRWSALIQGSYPRHLDGRGKVPDEGYWYFTNKIAPIPRSIRHSTPLSFYSVAPMEWLFGVRYLPGRVLMIVLHLAVSYSLISLARGLAVRLAGVGAVV